MFKEKSLFFAPMEGITDVRYRETIHECFPEWDYYSTDFLRVPAAGMYPNKIILDHYGLKQYQDPLQKKKTLYQILTSDKAFTQEVVTKVKELGFEWLDLNLGCPSRKVCSHKGGSFLLSELKTLEQIIKTIRNSFPHHFSAKIRVGYKDDTLFLDILSILEEQGVDSITIHARTRDQLYKGVANWDYIKKAVKHCNVPIVGNGDIWSVNDIHKFFDYTNCHSVMIARGAMKTPWLARNFHQGITQESQESRMTNIQIFFKNYQDKLLRDQQEEVHIIKRMKAISRYLFDDFEHGESMKKSFLRSKSMQEINSVIGLK